MAVFLVTGICLAAIAYFLYKYSIDRPEKFPPGPPKLPIFGSYLFLLAVNYKCLHRASMYFSKLYKSEIIGFHLGAFPAIVANSYEGIKQIFTREEFAGRPDIFVGRIRDPHCNRRGIFFNDGSKWKEQRRFYLRYMRDYGFGRRFEDLEIVINEELQELVDILKNGPKYPHDEEFFKKGAGLAPYFLSRPSIYSYLYIISKERVPSEEKNIHNGLSKAALGFMRRGDSYGLLLSQIPWIRHCFPTLSGYIPVKATTKVMYDFFRKCVEDNVQTFDEDYDRNFIDMYIRKVKEDEKNGKVDTSFEYDQLILSLVDFCIPQASSFIAQQALLLQCLLSNPYVVTKVQEEIEKVVGTGRLPSLDDRKDMPYTEAMIREGLRIQTLTPSSLPHQAVVDTELLGYRIPKGTIVLPGLDCFHHDKTIWKDPEIFRPERFLDNSGQLDLKKDISLPFGAGTRLCPGEYYARSMLFLTTTALCQNFDISLGAGQPLPDISQNLFGVIQSPPDFWVNFKARAS